MAPTQTIVPEITQQIGAAYVRTQQELGQSGSMAQEVWKDALSQLEEIDFDNPHPQSGTPQMELIKAISLLHVAEQVCLAKAALFGGLLAD